ncbi:MAG: hypothetical protein II306_09050 [Clostridia bacterium]|nr:hypothetical protein [Clostridia bacterium]MEE1024694.1 hypothetical protein [Acutalibacteraceae bacterium]
MIEIKHPTAEQKEHLGIKYDAYIAVENNEILGFCEYYCADGITHLEKAECEETALLDGLIRQTMSSCLDNGCEEAVFTPQVKKEMVLLKIIKEDDNKLNVLDFFLKINGCANIF